MRYLISFNESVDLTNIGSNKEIAADKEEILDIFKDWVDDRNIDMVNVPMSFKRGYFIRHNNPENTYLTFYISFGIINLDNNLDLVRNYNEFESLELLKDRFISLGYGCKLDYFYQHGNSPSAMLSVYRK